MSATAARPIGAAPRRRSPILLLVATVAATTVAFGLATGTGPLMGPMAAEFEVSTGAVSLMFSGTLAAMLGTGVLAGPLAQRHGTRPLVLLGAALAPAGLLVAATAERFATACAGFALGVGVGAGCLFVPLLTAVGMAFDRHRGPALVLATAGGGTGVVLAPPTTVALVGTLGLRVALVVLAAAAAVVVAACAVATPPARAPGTPQECRPPARHLLRDPGIRRLYLGSVGVTAAMFVPFVHLPSFATAHGLGPGTGAGLVAVSGLASLVSRLAAVPLVAGYGAWRIYRSAAVLLAASQGLWLLGAGGPGLLAAFAVVFGVAHGAYVGLFPAVVMQLYGVDGIGLRLGVLHTSAAAGGLLGPSLAGLAVDLVGAPVAVVGVAAAFGVAGCAVLATMSPERIGARRACHRRPGREVP